MVSLLVEGDWGGHLLPQGQTSHPINPSECSPLVSFIMVESSMWMGLPMAFAVHVAFSMWTVLPLSPLVPTWVGWGRVWVSLQFLISRRRGTLLNLSVKLGQVYTNTPSLRKSPLGSPDSSPL